MIAFLRSGSLGTVGLAVTALGFAGVIALNIAPHALQRFATWRHIWEDPLDGGYQQTRALMCIASGGLFGLGAGRGWMRHVFAADSDVVFASLYFCAHEHNGNVYQEIKVGELITMVS